MSEEEFKWWTEWAKNLAKKIASGIFALAEVLASLAIIGGVARLMWEALTLFS